MKQSKMLEKLPKYRFQQFNFNEFEYRFDSGKSQLFVYLHYELIGKNCNLDKNSLSGDRNIERFTEIFTFPLEEKIWNNIDLSALERALSALHIIAGISYYKTYLPPRITGLELDDAQAKFWTKIYERGLGEFFYRNKIDFRGIVKFKATKDTYPSSFKSNSLKNRCLVPIGGGKDSLVTIELLKESKMNFTLFSLRDALPIMETAAQSGKNRIVIERKLDIRLFELNEAGALNGHIPITALIAFVSAVCGVLYDFRYLVFSLERSANYGQLIYHGMDINHQYSKSAEFEEDVRNYFKKYISSELEFFSILRPLNELMIAKIFASSSSFDKYFLHFTSCNTNFTINKKKNGGKWCCNCPKCAFVFLILAPYISRKKLIEIFGENMADRNDLIPLFEEILGLRNFKPFECVGTPEESIVAIELISKNPDYSNDILIKT